MFPSPKGTDFRFLEVQLFVKYLKVEYLFIIKKEIFYHKTKFDIKFAPFRVGTNKFYLSN